MTRIRAIVDNLSLAEFLWRAATAGAKRARLRRCRSQMMKFNDTLNDVNGEPLTGRSAGLYLQPGPFGAPAAKSIAALGHPGAMKLVKEGKFKQRASTRQ
jgi:hypothetical protein